METPKSNPAPKRIFDGDRVEIVQNINAYLTDGPQVFIENRKTPLSPDAPSMLKGSQPTDDGALLLTPDERDEILAKEPELAKFIRRIYGSYEYINRKDRYCFWLVDATPAELRGSRILTERIAAVREFRLRSPKAATQKCAETPTLFQEIRQPTTDYLAVPCTSSEKRKYVPIGFLTAETIATNLLLTVPDATLYHFGVMTSSVHMAWTRAVCGRLKSDYRYSATVVYNNFPWPTPTDAQRAEIERTARGILDARALYPDESLAALYDELVMPQKLRDAHRRNDAAVERAFGFPKGAPEPLVVAELMKRYSELSAGK